MTDRPKNLELERLVFFSDAVVAIAITLLALDLKVIPADGLHLRFSDFINAGQKFAAFLLSFILVAVFWKVHHEFYFFIQKINGRLLWHNVGWLFFVVLLPFTSSLISAHLHDTPAVLAYGLNVLGITVFQNAIWDYVAVRPPFLKSSCDERTIYKYRLSCNVAMINALLAVAICFFSPLVSFLLLFTRLPMFALARLLFKFKRKRAAVEQPGAF